MKKRTSRAKLKQETRSQIIDDISPYMFSNPNPIKRVLKVKQFPWAENQKEFSCVFSIFKLTKLFKFTPKELSKFT